MSFMGGASLPSFHHPSNRKIDCHYIFIPLFFCGKGGGRKGGPRLVQEKRRQNPFLFCVFLEPTVG